MNEDAGRGQRPYNIEDEWERGGMMSDEDRDRAFSAPAGLGGDKADVVRRRNCENARKARARKKMEVSQLQERAAQLKQAHLRVREQRRAQKDLLARKEKMRKETLRKFLDSRCSNQKDYKEWADIVEETFTMTLPITPYRWFSGQDVMNNSRVLFGIEHLMTDNGSLAVLIESLGSGTLQWRRQVEKGAGHGVKLVCDIGDDDMIVTGDSVMCCFVLRTTNAVEHGAKCEWFCRGMMSAKFSPLTEKIAMAEHVFDVTSLMQQLQTANGETDHLPVVPNTPQGACEPSTEARVITSAMPPFTVVRCNESWSRLCGYPQESIEGRSLGVLQGPDTDAAALATLKSEILKGRATSSLLVNYKQDGSRFLNFLRVYPLSGDALGSATHFLGVLQEQAEDPETKPTAPNSSAQDQPQPGQEQNQGQEDCRAKEEELGSNGEPYLDKNQDGVSAEAAPRPQPSESRHHSSCMFNNSVDPNDNIMDMEATDVPPVPGDAAESARMIAVGGKESQCELSASSGEVAGMEGGSPSASGAAVAKAATKDGRKGGTEFATFTARRSTIEDGEATGTTTTPAASSSAKQDQQNEGHAAVDARLATCQQQIRPPALPPPPSGNLAKVALKEGTCEDVGAGDGQATPPALQESAAVEVGGGIGREEEGGSGGVAESSGAPSHDSPSRAEDEISSLATNNSLRSIGISTGDSPNPFLAWEDVLVGSGDPLGDLGPLTVEQSLNEVGQRIVAGKGAGEGKDTEDVPDDQELDMNAERPRAHSHSVMARSNSRSAMEWGLPDRESRSLSAADTAAGADSVGIGGKYFMPGREDYGTGERLTEPDVERGLRAFSDGDSWDLLPPWLRGPAALSEPGVLFPQSTRSAPGQQVERVNGAETGSAPGAGGVGARLQMDGMARIAGASHRVGLAG